MSKRKKSNFKKIPVSAPDIGPLEKKYVVEVMNSGWISSIGPKVKEFEELFSKFVGTKYAVAVSNGTAALDLALMTLGIGPGDEVIVPTFTFAATVNAVIHQGAKPVFVDSSLNDWNIDPIKIKSVITPKTKAIIVVHIYGIPAPMEEILKIAKAHKLLVVEDAAEAHGALYDKKMVGSFGDIGCFSFFANKVMTTGEGGMCATNSKKLYEKMKIIYSHGSKIKKLIYYFHPVVGYNFRMTSLQAALGIAQLKRVKHFLKTRETHENLYRRFLKNIRGIKFSPKPSDTEPIYWMHSILLDGASMDRDKLMMALKKHGIETRPFFYPIHKMPPYIKYAQCQYPIAVYLSGKGINLPSSALLRRSDIKYISDSIKQILNTEKR